MNVTGALLFLVTTLMDLYIYVFVVRFLMQWARADFKNPLAQALVQISDPLVRPARRVIPGWGGIDIATLVVILILQITAVVIVTTLASGFNYVTGIGLISVLTMAALRFFHAFLNVILFFVFIRVILSWVAPGLYNPIVSIIYSVTEPVMAPFRRLLPPLGGLDLSPLFLLLSISAIKILIPAPF